MSKLSSDLMPLVTKLKELQSQATALGIFANDRELLACPGCGLQEDVAIDGRLITCRDQAPGIDTELRFAAHDNQSYCCPVCHQVAIEQTSGNGIERAAE